MNKSTVNIHGKEYETVASRVNRFRDEFGLDLSIVTELIDRDETTVVMKASIIKDSSVIATGYAEESRASSMINRTSALENCETSAIGRALAAFGMAGTEYASADEVAQAINQQPVVTDTRPKQLTEKQKKYLDELKFQIFGQFNTAGLSEAEEQKQFIADLIGKPRIETIEEAQGVLNEAQALNS